jgi:predicted nucleic acid-binding protein
VNFVGRLINLITAIDTNILLDILLEDNAFMKRSKKLLLESMDEGGTIISPCVYSELYTRFIKSLSKNKAGRELDAFLSKIGIDIIPFTKRSLQIAGESWTIYTRSKGKNRVICPKCGEKNQIICNKCQMSILWRNHIITDFLIGGHAQDLGDRLLTRDRGYYKRYFPNLQILK